MLKIQNGHNATIVMHNKGLSVKHIMKMFKVLHPNVLDGALVWDVGTYHGVHWPITNSSGSQNGLVFEKQNKDVVLQPIKIMRTIEILDQSTTLAGLVDLIDEMFTSIRNTTMEFPTL